ncbi:hypothetical protein GCM10022221_06900 [Actinocorallia aurea]
MEAASAVAVSFLNMGCPFVGNLASADEAIAIMRIPQYPDMSSERQSAGAVRKPVGGTGPARPPWVDADL